jgi:hypothetical protein
MNSFPRLLCVATLATAAAFAQTSTGSFVASDPSLASESQTTAQTVRSQPNQSDLQVRSMPEHTVLPTATVLRLKLTRSISTASAKPGEQFTATLSQPVEIDGRTIVPSGAFVNCRVEHAHGARRFHGKPSLSIKARSVRMPDGEEFQFTASVVDTSNPRKLDVDQEGSVRGASANPMDKVEMGSLAGAGAIAGAVIAGPEGLLIGTAAGAGVAAGHIVIKHRELTLPAGTELIFELDAPATTGHSQMGGLQ